MVAADTRLELGYVHHIFPHAVPLPDNQHDRFMDVRCISHHRPQLHTRLTGSARKVAHFGSSRHGRP